MKKVKSVSDVAIRHVVDMWMREYDFSDSPKDLPRDWPAAWDDSDNRLYVGDPLWMEDFIYQMEEDVEIIGTFGDVLDRIDNQPMLKKAIERAEEIREESIKNFEREYQSVLARQKVLENKLKIKSNPWTPVAEMPTLIKNDSDRIFQQYLVTDGQEVYVAQLSAGWIADNVYFYCPGIAKEIKITHWMPVDRLLIYLED